MNVTSVETHLRTKKSVPVALSRLQIDQTTNINKLKKVVKYFNPVVQKTFLEHRRDARAFALRGLKPKFANGDYVLDALKDSPPWKSYRYISMALYGWYDHFETMSVKWKIYKTV